jgi:hypothetical protein
MGCLVLCFATPILGQTKPVVLQDTAPTPSARFPADWYPPPDNTTYTTDVVTGAPYVATLVTTFHAVNPTTKESRTISASTLQARDSKGRRRDEEDNSYRDSNGVMIHRREITVYDPVSHCTFIWDEPWTAEGKPTASVACMPLAMHYRSFNVWVSSFAQPPDVHQMNEIFLSEPIGKRDFGGVEAEGIRRTNTITSANGTPTRSGAFELWYSADLKEMIEMKEIPDPKTFQMSAFPNRELTEIRRIEPDPALFYPPPGYAIEPHPAPGVTSSHP